MEFLGNKYLSLSYQTGLSFELDFSINNINSICNLGFSGENKNLNFKFESGKIFDPENRLVSFYSSGENINISGDISPRNYSYYINDNLLCLNGKKDNFIISGYYINSPDSIVNSDIRIQGTRPQYELYLSPVFYITGTEYLTGSITNLNNLNFKIYSGSITIPSNFSIQSISEFVYDTGYFNINTYSATQNQLEDERLYEVQLNLFTNFGTITKNFTTTGSFSGYLNVNLNLENITNFFARTGLQTGLGDFKDNDYSLIYSIISGSLRSPQVNLDKYINIQLKYYTGYTGEITGNLLATGYKNLILTGFINGSGFLNGLSSLPMTGYHALSGINITGLLTGYASEFTFFTGFSNFNLNLPTTGYYLSRVITGNRSFDVTAFTSTGIIDYNNYITNNFPIKVETFPTGLTGSFGQFISSNESGSVVFVSNLDFVNINHSTGRVYAFTGNQINWRNVNFISGLRGDKYFGQTIIDRRGDEIFITSKRGSLLNNTGISGRVYRFIDYTQNIIDAEYFEKSGNFGNSLAINSGNILIIGANYADGGTGAAFVYKSENISGYSRTNIIYSDPGADALGTSISVSRDEKVILAGIPNNSTFFSLNGGVWILTGDGNFYEKSIKIYGDRIGVDNFGASVALNGNGYLGLIGASSHQEGATNFAGQVFILTGNGITWATGARLTGDGGTDQFGTSVAINDYGNIGLVGASNDNSNVGAVWFITGSGIIWSKIEPKITGNTINSAMGRSVALNSSGNIAVVGSPLDRQVGSDAGAVWIITGDNFIWNTGAKILPPSALSYFGTAVDINKKGDIIAIGSNNFNNPGYAYIYTGSGNNWIQTDIFTGENVADYFGISVSLNDSGNILSVGAVRNSDDVSLAGAVYIYTGAPNNFKFFDKIKGRNTNAQFGSRSKILQSGNALVVGEPRNSTITLNGGALNFYRNILLTGFNETQRIVGQISNSSHNFSQSISINNNGNNLLIGAINAPSSGYAYIFTGSYNANYELVSILNRTNGQNGDLFGYSTSLNKLGNIAAIGAPGYSSSRGAIYIFTGNLNNQWFQNSFISGTVNAPTEFGHVLKLNDLGDLLAVASYNTDPITYPNISGAIHLYTGSGDNKQQWVKLRTIDEVIINGNSNLNLKSGLEFINNEYADLLFFSDYFSNTGYVQVVSNINQTGFIGYLTGSGVIQLNENNYLLTGLLTGQRYNKTFTDAFNLITGYYLNGTLTGLQDFKLNNYILNNSYINSGFISNDVSQLYIQAKTRNYFSNDIISGLLIVSGYETGKYTNSVINTIITGIR
jgi:hypothetical protein